MTAPSPPTPDVFKTPLALCECMFEWMYERNPLYAKDKNLKNKFFQKYNISMTMNNVNKKHDNDGNNNPLYNNNDDTSGVMNDNNNHDQDDINQDKNNIDMVDDQLKVPAWDWDAISKKMNDRGVPYSSVHCAILWKYIAYGKKYSDNNLNSNAMYEDEDKEDAYYQPFTAIRRFSLCKNSDKPQLFLPSLSFDCKIQDLLQSTGAHNSVDRNPYLVASNIANSTTTTTTDNINYSSNTNISNNNVSNNIVYNNNNINNSIVNSNIVNNNIVSSNNNNNNNNIVGSNIVINNIVNNNGADNNRKRRLMLPITTMPYITQKSPKQTSLNFLSIAASANPTLSKVLRTMKENNFNKSYLINPTQLISKAKHYNNLTPNIQQQAVNMAKIQSVYDANKALVAKGSVVVNNSNNTSTNSRCSNTTTTAILKSSINKHTNKIGISHAENITDSMRSQLMRERLMKGSGNVGKVTNGRVTYDVRNNHPTTVNGSSSNRSSSSSSSSNMGSLHPTVPITTSNGSTVLLDRPVLTNNYFMPISSAPTDHASISQVSTIIVPQSEVVASTSVPSITAGVIIPSNIDNDDDTMLSPPMNNNHHTINIDDYSNFSTIVHSSNNNKSNHKAISVGIISGMANSDGIELQRIVTDNGDAQRNASSSALLLLSDSAVALSSDPVEAPFSASMSIIMPSLDLVSATSLLSTVAVPSSSTIEALSSSSSSSSEEAPSLSI